MAVKTMVFPANMSGMEKREKMAIMETAIRWGAGAGAPGAVLVSKVSRRK